LQTARPHPVAGSLAQSIVVANRHDWRVTDADLSHALASEVEAMEKWFRKRRSRRTLGIAMNHSGRSPRMKKPRLCWGSRWFAKPGKTGLWAIKDSNL
jgi:hypothetical protein